MLPAIASNRTNRLSGKQSNKWRNLLILKGLVVQSITGYPQKYPQTVRYLPDTHILRTRFIIIRVVGNLTLAKANIRIEG